MPVEVGVVPIAIGVVASFFIFWKIQFCAYSWRLWRLGIAFFVLVVSFLLIAYGTEVLLN